MLTTLTITAEFALNNKLLHIKHSNNTYPKLRFSVEPESIDVFFYNTLDPEHQLY
ncbi:hypothetical protein GCM10008111_22650 [Alishewanella tabrizica]|uniref:Uncharacterized protein n=1 Tax=Alishewanella tabrizica TaxID=671278 RepID=A0ABQ2WPU0_9ALTE|nr:hypothetical protein GCM10008111_22650 [Alishewanella tabrizica]